MNLLLRLLHMRIPLAHKVLEFAGIAGAKQLEFAGAKQLCGRRMIVDGRLPNGTVLHQTEHDTVRQEWGKSIGGGAKASVMGDIAVLPYSVLPLAAVSLVLPYSVLTLARI